MTGPEDSHTSTRPISVAELLARNGTIGSPPVGGRRRRRRGNADAVTVAELTGEIPVITDDTLAPDEDAAPQSAEPEDTGPDTETPDTETPEATEPEATGPDTETPEATGPEQTVPDEAPEALQAALEPTADSGSRTRDAEEDYQEHLKAREAAPEPVVFQPVRRPVVRDYQPTGTATGAELMSPDFLDADFEDDDSAGDTDDDANSRSAAGLASALFRDDAREDEESRDAGSGDTDDLDGDDLDADDLDELDHQIDEPAAESDEDDDGYREPRGKQIAHGAWVGAQCVLAVAFGAGLFLAFLQLWKWNVIVALVLGVLVILGLAGGVRVVRKTEDIGSTLTAVAVGALVTFGPLALQAALQAS